MLLEHLRELFAGISFGLINMPSLCGSSKQRPFDYQELDPDGLLCCYVWHKEVPEIGCKTLKGAKEMLICDGRQFDQELNTLHAPGLPNRSF